MNRPEYVGGVVCPKCDQEDIYVIVFNEGRYIRVEPFCNACGAWAGKGLELVNSNHPQSGVIYP